MDQFSLFNPNFKSDKYTTAVVNDGAHKFAFLFSYLGQYNGEPKFVMYWPDYNPGSFGFAITYRITISHWEGPYEHVDIDQIIYPGDTVAMVPFRYEDNTYNEFSPINWEVSLEGEDWPELEIPQERTWYYISIKPWIGDIETGRPDRGFTGSQAAFNILNDFNLSLDANEMNTELTIRAFQGKQEMSMEELLQEIQAIYKKDDVRVKSTIYIADPENVYGKIDVSGNTCPNPSVDRWSSIVTPKPEDFFSKWYDSMRIFGWLKFYRVVDGEEVMLIGYRTNMVPVTQKMWCFWMAGSEIEEGDFNMSNFPRTINKTIQQVTNISTSGDSKAGIVQPVFVRVRDLANIVVHPAVVENIVINLDAYKSSCSRFMIRIEGATFHEIGRIAGGVVFNVNGNMLRGTISEGTYYILDQDANLVTTGKYRYEY